MGCRVRIASQAADDPAVVQEAVDMSEEQRWSWHCDHRVYAWSIAIVELWGHGDGRRRGLRVDQVSDFEWVLAGGTQGPLVVLNQMDIGCDCSSRKKT